MKFTQLKIGERFYYKNASYTKTGPLQAIKDGSTNPQLIMRSAMVQTTAEQKVSDSPGQTATDRLLQAINAYHNGCKTILQAAVADADTDALDRLEMRYQELLQALDKE